VTIFNMHPLNAESITKPLETQNRSCWFGLSNTRESIDHNKKKGAKKEMQIVRARARVCRIGWHTLTATTETGLKCRNYLQGLCIRASLRWNTSQLSHSTMHLYSDATRNGSPSASSKKGFSYR